MPKNIKEHVVRSLIMQDNQAVDSEIIILIGTGQNNKRIIVLDSNNDEDFEGERVLEYDYPLSIERQISITDSLPIIPVTYEYYYNGETITKKIALKPIPYQGHLNITYNAPVKDIEKKYYLSLEPFPNYKKGTFKIDTSEYNVYVSKRFIKFDFSNQQAQILISKKGEKTPSELNGDIPYTIGDIFNSNGQDYKIEEISASGNSLKFKYLGRNSKPEGITKGFYFPKSNTKALDGSSFKIENYKGNYVLFDFWGTWCVPCIKAIPELKELNNTLENKNFILISVAFDSDIKKVSDFVTRENMDWKHLFVSQTESDSSSMIQKLKVSSFPTLILVGPKGKIIARNKEIEELKKILSEKTKAI